MFVDDRLTRLRALIARLERLPASPESAWLIAEARARMVDVETGERPGGMRPLVPEPPAEVPRPRREVQPRSVAPETVIDDPPPLDTSASDDLSAAVIGTDGLLWLEDSPNGDDIALARDDGDPEAEPWRRGLRG